MSIHIQISGQDKCINEIRAKKRLTLSNGVCFLLSDIDLGLLSIRNIKVTQLRFGSFQGNHG